MLKQHKTKTKTLEKAKIHDVIWALVKDRIEEDARKISSNLQSYTESNRVPGAGE